MPRESDKNLLDNTSSVPVVLPLARKRKVKREYEIEYKGAKVKCSSLRAAADLLKELGGDKQNPGMIPWDDAEFAEFTGKLELFPVRLLGYLVQHFGGSDEQLREHLRLRSNQALAGVLSGITKVANSLDIEPERVYRQNTTYHRGKPHRHYFIGQMFKKAAVAHDWPSETDLNPPSEESEGEGE